MPSLGSLIRPGANIVDDFIPQLVGLIQAIAIAHNTWRGADTALAELAAKALGDDTRTGQIRSLIHCKELQSALINRQVALWIGPDGLARLVDQQSVSNRAAAMRVTYYPGSKTCLYCLMLEPNQEAMVPERDNNGHPVQGHFIHEKCQAAWARLKRQVAGEQ